MPNTNPANYVSGQEVQKPYYTTPNEVFEAARYNPIVHAVVTCWESGHCSWEQALMTAVVALVKQNKKLDTEVTKAFLMKP